MKQIRVLITTDGKNWTATVGAGGAVSALGPMAALRAALERRGDTARISLHSTAPYTLAILHCHGERFAARKEPVNVTG
jgi:hypothetical protein